MFLPPDAVLPAGLLRSGLLFVLKLAVVSFVTFACVRDRTSRRAERAHFRGFEVA
jgi:hypothetical protein